MPDRTSLVTPPAVQMNARRIVAAGIGLFFVAFVVSAIGWTWLRDHDHLIWFWTSLAGWLIGLLGYALMTRHRAMGRTV